MFFCPFQTISRRFRRRRRRNLGQYARSLRTSFCCSKTYIKMVKKGQKQSKQVTNTICSCLLTVSDYVSKISSPKATKSRTVGPFITNNGPARLCKFRRRRRRTTGQRPVHVPVYLRRGCNISSPKATKLRAVCLFNMIDGPKARIPASTV